MNSFGVSCVLFMCFLTSLSSGENISYFKERQNAKEILLSYKSLKSPIGDGEIVEEIHELQANMDYYIHAEYIPDWAQFIVVQTHVYLHNVTLSYTIKKVEGKYVTGQNIGLMQNVTSAETAQLFLLNENPFNVTALLTIVAYTKNAPVPGGCNIEASVPVAPWLGVGVTGPTVVVTSAPAQAPAVLGTPGICDPVLHYQTYHLYLPEKDFTSDTYFQFISKMLTVKRITDNARKVPDLGFNPLKHVFSAYHGTGSVFAVVVSSSSAQYAVYVPALSYTCSPSRYTDTCQVLTSTFSRALCALVLFIGLFVCFYGHSFFQTELFLFSTLVGSMITYVIVAPHGLSDAANIGIATVGGVTLAGMWLLLWWVFGSPLLSVVMALSTLGYLVASVVIYFPIVNQAYLVHDMDYWMCFTCLVILVGLMFARHPDIVNIVACAVVGSYAAIVPIDHYVGGNLKYIFINTMRRATVPGFGEAIIDPPFQMKDLILAAVWVVLAVTGLVKQSQRFSGDRPAFPPSSHPWGTPLPPSTPRTSAERKPLLASPGSDSVFS
ncbi:transmembrane 7 superfamily member 3-like [Macrosteles quadrilineatus]|uniref:transmembrane 7 superfamily member 3-like n=1 Tax=Macrosteles quadrilineatus TaxID=74068 RepID=UPI0023E08FDE|nr:transmembrane 7 superfamily member 3-like [Macrosteles quadrilineatus]